MRVSSSKTFSVSLTISLHLSHVNPSSPTEIDKLYMWQTVQITIAGEEAILLTVIDEWYQLHLPLLFDELVKNWARKKKTIIGSNSNANGTASDKLTS